MFANNYSLRTAHYLLYLIDFIQMPYFAWWLIAQRIAVAATDTTYLRFLLPISSMQMIFWEQNQLAIARLLFLPFIDVQQRVQPDGIAWLLIITIIQHDTQ